MNRLALLLVLALCLPVAARADEASQRAKAQELITLLNTNRMVTQVAANILKQLSDASEKAVGPDATPENKAKLADFEKKMSPFIDDQVGWKVMEPAFTDIYTKTFTEEEMAAIVAFYKTPAGVAFLEKTPTINAKATQLAQSRIAALQPQLRQMFEDFRKSLDVTPAPASPAASPASTTPAAPVASPATATPSAPATTPAVSTPPAAVTPPAAATPRTPKTSTPK